MATRKHPQAPSADARSLTRRGLLGLMGAGALTVAGASAVAAAEPPPPPRPRPAPRPDFHGRHQQGITSPAQQRLSFTSLDLTTSSRQEVVDLLRGWTATASAFAAGRAPEGMASAGVVDAAELAASNVSITVGFGPSLFRDRAGRDRFGLASQQPTTFAPLPAFSNDRLVPGLSGGDLCLQVCSDSEQVAHHVVRSLLQQGSPVAKARWSQAGFSNVSPDAPGTPRNLFGFKDGSANIARDDYASQERFVWVQPGDGPAWMTGGTYAAVRKIAMNLPTWDAEPVEEQEHTIGRAKVSGAPLSGGTEFTVPNLTATGADGAPAIDVASHVALSHPNTNDGQRILRRGYNYIDGTDRQGRMQAGLFFVAFNRDTTRQFIPMMHRLAQADLMNEYLTYLSSSTFAIPPGSSAGGFIGETLLG